MRVKTAFFVVCSDTTMAFIVQDRVYTTGNYSKTASLKAS